HRGVEEELLRVVLGGVLAGHALRDARRKQNPPQFGRVLSHPGAELVCRSAGESQRRPRAATDGEQLDEVAAFELSRIVRAVEGVEVDGGAKQLATHDAS